MYDRASGDLRFFELLTMLAKTQEVSINCFDEPQQRKHVGAGEVARYKNALREIGAKVLDAQTVDVLRGPQHDVILFEFYHAATRYLPEARLWQRTAVKIVDSVDIHYKRLLAKARLSRADEDFRLAAKVARDELDVYRIADHVIAVSEEDRALLLAEDPSLSVWTIPNVHRMRPFNDGSTREPDSLLFVGGFDHEPNVDAARYLCTEIMPLVWSEVPTAVLYVVGDSPPEAICALAEKRIQVVGYVADLEAYLRRVRVSVAPLRYGAGMKGKVGQALAAGLPVVTTTVGAEGFGVTPGRELLVADDPREFSRSIISLLRNAELYRRISTAGREFVASRFSPRIVEATLLRYLESARAAPLRRLTLRDRMKMMVPLAVRDSVRRLWSA